MNRRSRVEGFGFGSHSHTMTPRIPKLTCPWLPKPQTLNPKGTVLKLLRADTPWAWGGTLQLAELIRLPTTNVGALVNRIGFGAHYTIL